MVMQILSHTPVWVWGLLAALVALGWSQTRQRQVAPARLLLLPLGLCGLGLWSMAPSFRALPLAALVWLVAGGAGLLLLAGRPAQAGATWLPAVQRLQLPGSWMPMLLILGIFSLRYAVQVGLAMHPSWRSAPWVLLPLALFYGGLSGLLLGRALALLRLTRAPAVVRPPSPWRPFWPAR